MIRGIWISVRINQGRIKVKKILCTIIGLCCLQITAVQAELDPLKNYDNFNAKKFNGCKNCIDGEKWGGGERWHTNAEVSRGIKSKRVRLSNRVYGETDDDGGTVQGRNRLLFKDSENFSGVCFTPRALKYEINTCKGNDSSGSAQVRYVGNFYDADNDDVEDDENGLVYAWFGLRRWSDDGNKKGIFNVSGGASQCLGDDCEDESWSTWDENFNNPDLWFDAVKGNNNKKEFCVGYDRENHELVFSFGKKVRTVDATHGLPPFDDDVNQGLTWQVLETRVDAQNCTDGIRSSYVEGDFDNVKVRKFSYPPM